MGVVFFVDAEDKQSCAVSHKCVDSEFAEDVAEDSHGHRSELRSEQISDSKSWFLLATVETDKERYSCISYVFFSRRK